MACRMRRSVTSAVRTWLSTMTSRARARSIRPLLKVTPRLSRPAPARKRGSAAQLVAAEVEMQVVAMGAVVVRRQHRPEIVAGPVPDLVQERPLPRRPAPAARHRHLRPVLQRKAGYIDGVGV